MEENPPQPARKAIRLPGYDYSLPGAYFITLVTEQRVCQFGHVTKNEVKLNSIGELITLRWEYLPRLFHYVTLGEYILMPNHLHAILWILEHRQENQINGPRIATPENFSMSTLQRNATAKNSLGSIIQNFKSVTSRLVKTRFGLRQLWQRGYYDRVIRNEQELTAINEYIIANPTNWSDDEENQR